MAEYSRLASGQVTSVLTGAPTSVILPFIPNYIEILNKTRLQGTSSGVSRASWMTDMGQGSAFLVTTTNGASDLSAYIDVVGGTSTTGFTNGTGFSTFQGALDFQFGPAVQIASITKASPAVVTTATNHNLVSGNVVVLYGLYESPTTGMAQIAGIPFVVTVTGATTFTINWNTNQSNFTALTASPTGAFMKQILYPNLYAPSVGFISALTLSTTTTVTTTAPTNFQVGQEVAFRIPSLYGTTQLNSLPNNIIPGSPMYGFVTAVNSAVQFVVNINSSGYTAFNSNQTMASVPGLSFPQVIAVGDINSGGFPYTGAQLYPSPALYNGTGTGTTLSINGPAIQGAFVNNTSMGFIIGGGISGTTGDIIYWRAYMHDINY